MSTQEFLILCLVGGLAGWLASTIVRGSGLGLFGNIAVGILGSFVGGWLFGRVLKTQIVTDSVWLNDILISSAGAIVLLLVIGIIYPKGKRR
ncbi:MAG: GlsB/YeaQ/YmgE family stress response membrane protein [Bacteroidota bacterium]